MSPYFEDGKAEHNIDNPRQLESTSITDYMSMGFVIPAWCDITIESRLTENT